MLSRLVEPNLTGRGSVSVAPTRMPIASDAIWTCSALDACISDATERTTIAHGRQILNENTVVFMGKPQIVDTVMPEIAARNRCRHVEVILGNNSCMERINIIFSAADKETEKMCTCFIHVRYSLSDIINYHLINL